MAAADVKYPLKVDYCPNCGMPFEVRQLQIGFLNVVLHGFLIPQYCEYYPDYENCKKWLEENMPDKFAELSVEGEGDDGGEEGKKRQKRGGKGMVKVKKKEADKAEKKVLLSIAPRGKKKSVTVVQGLRTFGIDLKVASKFFGQKFACGASITGDDEIVIQGDCKDDLFDIIPEKWPEVDEDLIEDLGEKKR